MKTEIKIKTIKDIISLKKENVLRVNEEYQRADNLWSKRQKIFLIDSIMREYPIPLFYFHIRSKEAAGYGGTLPDIIDGQQRVDTIYEFSNDDFKLMDPKKSSGIPRFLGQKECPWVGKKFSEFNPELREQFLKTKLNIVEIQTNDENEVRDLFVRLQAGLPLTAQEKRDAWPGEFTTFVINTAGKGKKIGHKFFRNILAGTGGKRGEVRRRQTCAQLFMLFYTAYD